MKKVKLMFATIVIAGTIAGALAFKTKNFNIYCLYRTTTTWAYPNGPIRTVCQTFDLVELTPYPYGVVFYAAFITPSLCWDLPATTPTQYCNNVYTVTILP